MGHKKFFNFKNLFFVSFLAVAGIFSATAIIKDKQVEEAPVVEKAEATYWGTWHLNYKYPDGSTGYLNMYQNGSGDETCYADAVILKDEIVWIQNTDNNWNYGYNISSGTGRSYSEDIEFDGHHGFKINTSGKYSFYFDVEKRQTIWFNYSAYSDLPPERGYYLLSNDTDWEFPGSTELDKTTGDNVAELLNFKCTAEQEFKGKALTNSSNNLNDWTNYAGINENCTVGETVYAHTDNVWGGNIIIDKTSYFNFYWTAGYQLWISLSHFTISLNQAGGSGGSSSVSDVIYGEAMPSITLPTKPGYTFGGYYTGENGTGTKYYNADGSSAAAWAEDGTTTLYAKWTAKNYSVSYALNGGSHGTTHPTTGTFGTAFYVSAPSKTGFTFTGWTVTAGLNSTYAKWGTTSSPSTTITNSSTKCVNGPTGNVYFLNINESSTAVTLTANWDPNQYTYTTGTLPTGVASLTCTRYSSPNKGASTGTVASGDPVYYGDKLYWSATASTGYTITTLNYSSTSDLYTVGTSGNIVGVTVTSVAATANTYTISYKDQGNVTYSGSNIEDLPDTHTYGVATELVDGEKTGYEFDGWFTTSTCTGDPITSIGATQITADTTLYAKWTAKTCKLVFDLDYGSGPSPTNLSATYGQAMPNYTSDAPWRNPGYTFGGYYTEKNGGGTCYYTSELQSANIWAIDTTSDTTLYAYWIAKTTTVTFEKNGGSGGSDGFTATYDAAVPDITVPTKTGYTFQGYYTEGGYQVYTSTGKGGKIWSDDSAEVTLYARWRAIKYDVSITAGSGISSAYLSSDTSGSPTATSFDYGSTVYGFVVLQGGYAHASASWDLVSGTADTQGAVYRVGSLTVSTSGNDFGTINALSGETAAINYAKAFNSAVGAVCDDYSTNTKADFIAIWNTDGTSSKMEYNYSQLPGYVQYWLAESTKSSDTNVAAMLVKYDYVLSKYGYGAGSDNIHDFLGRTPATSSAIRNFTPFELLNSGDDNNITTVIVIVSSAVALLSITALSILMVKKRKRKEY